MKYSWQFDPLQPDKPVELTCDGTVIATTSLNNAQELANKLNSHTDLYEALKAIYEGVGAGQECIGSGRFDKMVEALAKAEEVKC